MDELQLRRRWTEICWSDPCVALPSSRCAICDLRIWKPRLLRAGIQLYFPSGAVRAAMRVARFLARTAEIILARANFRGAWAARLPRERSDDLLVSTNEMPDVELSLRQS